MAVPEEEYAPEGGSGLPPFLMDPLGVLKRRWRWMVATLAMAALPAVAVVLLFPMAYESTAKMLIAGHTIPDELVPSTIEEGVDSQVNAMVAEFLIATGTA